MAFTGLGAGTQADPYQITTIVQFNEMNNASYAGVYFLLMNDLDFINTSVFSLNNFYCNFNGGNYSLNNISGTSGSMNGFYLNDGCSINNVSIHINRGDICAYKIFNSSATKTLINVNISNIKILADPNLLVLSNGTYVFNTNITLENSCNIKHIIVEGTFNYVFYKLNCIIENCSFNLYNLQSFCSSFYSLAILRYCYINILVVQRSVSKTITSNYLFNISSRGLITNNIIRIPYIHKYNTTSVFGIFGTLDEFVIENNLIISNELYSDTGSISICYMGYPSASNGLRNNFYSGNVHSPFNLNKNIFYNHSQAYESRISSNYYRKSKVIGNTPTDVIDKQVGLTDSQCLLESSFSGWDFTSVWEMGDEYPILRAVTEPVFYYPNNEVAVRCERLSSNSFECLVYVSDLDINYGIDIYDTEDNLLSNYENTINVVVNDILHDSSFVIRPYIYFGTDKIYQNELTYNHYYSDTAVSLIKITSNSYTALSNGALNGRFIHGTCLVGDYMYGSSRGSIDIDSNYCSIVKVQVSNPNNILITNIYGSETNNKVSSMDSLINIGNYLYTIAYNTMNTHQLLVKYNLLTDDYQVFKVNTGQGFGCPSTTDGDYLYVYSKSNIVYKIDVANFVSELKFNTATTWSMGTSSYNAISKLSDTSLNPHTLCVDDEYLYIGYGTSFNIGQHEVHKIRKLDMTFVSKAFVPKMTDDMCQTATHLFIGIELYDSNNISSFGYNWGACAIRKSDMNVTKIPRLHSTQSNNNGSYASIIFGNYLIDTRSTDGYIYVIDISDVDNWSIDENIGNRTISSYQVYKTNGTSISSPINEVFRTESGRFIGFGWSGISDVLSFDLPDLNFFSVPSISNFNTNHSNGIITLIGYLIDYGGKAIIQRGFKYGLSSEVLTETILSTDTTNEFSAELPEGLIGTYYFKAFATNSEGESDAEVKGFSRLNYHWRVKVVSNGKTVYGNDQQVIAFKNLIV